MPTYGGIPDLTPGCVTCFLHSMVHVGRMYFVPFTFFLNIGGLIIAGTQHGLTRLDQLVKTCIHGNGPARPFAQTLGRVMPPNPVHISNITHADVIAALDELATGMGVNENTDGPADAGMTFFGQSVDHDVTLDATSALGTRIDPATIPNVRTPSLDLDCVYGAGPEA